MTTTTWSRWFQRAISLLRNVVRRDQDEREIADEVSAHLSLRIEEKVRSGMKPEEANEQRTSSWEVSSR